MATRRQFLQVAGAGAAGLAFTPASSYARIQGANDRIRVGLIGFSDRTRGSLIPAFQQHAAALNFELVAVSDIWSKRRDAASAHLQKVTGRAPNLCRNNDELYDRKDVDAVISATPEHWRALTCIHAWPAPTVTAVYSSTSTSDTPKATPPPTSTAASRG